MKNFPEIVRSLEDTDRLPLIHSEHKREFFNILYGIKQDAQEPGEIIEELLDHLADEIDDLAEKEREEIEADLWEADGNEAESYFECLVSSLDYYAENVAEWLNDKLNEELLPDELEHLTGQIYHDMIEQSIKFDHSYWVNGEAILSLCNEGEEYHPISDKLARLLDKYKSLVEKAAPFLDELSPYCPDFERLLTKCDIVDGEWDGFEPGQLVFMLSRPQQVGLFPSVTSLAESLAEYRQEREENDAEEMADKIERRTQ